MPPCIVGGIHGVLVSSVDTEIEGCLQAESCGTAALPAVEASIGQ